MPASGRSTSSKAEALPGVKAVVTARPICPDLEAEGEATARRRRQRHGARQGALRRPRGRRGGRGRRRRGEEGAAADRGRLGGAAARHRRRRGDAAGRPRAPRGHAAPRASSPSRPSPPTSPRALEYALGDLEKGFAEADVVVERSSTPRACIRATSSPMPASRATAPTARPSCGCTTQGHSSSAALLPGVLRWTSRAARHLVRDRRRFRRQDHGLHRAGGARAVEEGRPAGEDRHDPRRGVPRQRPDRRHQREVKIGTTKDGRIVAADGRARVPGRRLPGLAGERGAMRAFAPYDIENVASSATTSSPTGPRPRPIARRARRCRPSASRSCSTRSPQQLGMDPMELRLKNAAKEGTKAAYGPTFGPIGMVETVRGARPSQRQGAAGAEPGPRRRLRLLVQFRRRVLHRPQHRQRRHRRPLARHPRHRRQPRLDVR